MKNVFFLGFLMLLFSCNSEKVSNSESVEEPKEAEAEEIDGALQVMDLSPRNSMEVPAKQWLVRTIESYFDPDDDEFMDISYFSTDEYVEFKQDAMSVNIPDELTEKEFRVKWKHRNVELIGMQNGFMISAQDYHTVKVTECNLKDQIDESTSLFNVVVEDLVYKGKYIREVTVSKAGNSFIINDVAEIKEILPE